MMADVCWLDEKKKGTHYLTTLPYVRYLAAWQLRFGEPVSPTRHRHN